jgi:hypothetical protein
LALREYALLGLVQGRREVVDRTYTHREEELLTLLGVPEDRSAGRKRQLKHPTLAALSIEPDVPRAPHLDLAWLAGFIDGEGSISMREVTECSRSTGLPRYSYHPRVRYFNTHQPTLAYVRSVLDAHGLGYVVSHSRQNDARYAPLWTVTVEGLGRCKALLELLVPCLKTKQDDAALVLEYCQLRQPGRALSPREREILTLFGIEPRGQANRHGNALLSADEVRAARRVWDRTEATLTELARQYGLSVPAMHAIVHRKTYRHVWDEDETVHSPSAPARA